MTEPRRCAATTKTGEPCKSPGVLDNGYCMGHQPKEEKKARGFGGPQPGSGRPKNPRSIEMIREAIEAEAERILAPLWEGLTAEKSVVVGNGPTAHVEQVPDIPTRLAAAREFLDRGWGKPKQHTEITGPHDGPVEMVSIIPPDSDVLSARAAALLAKYADDDDSA